MIAPAASDRAVLAHADRVTVRREGRDLLHDVTLAVAAGEVVAIVGPNGAGKSTLLRVLAGELRPTSGVASVLGQALPRWKAIDLARVRAVLPQSSALSFPFTAREVVRLGRWPHADRGVDAHADEISSAALAAVGLGGWEERLYPTLSGGEQQRVHLARVLAQVWRDGTASPRLLLLDEPSASLDLAQAQLALALVRRFASEGGGALVVLHDLHLAAGCADRVALLCDGRVIALGEPRVVLTEENLERAYGIPVRVVDDPRVPHPFVVPLVSHAAAKDAGHTTGPPEGR